MENHLFSVKVWRRRIGRRTYNEKTQIQIEKPFLEFFVALSLMKVNKGFHVMRTFPFGADSAFGNRSLAVLKSMSRRALKKLLSSHNSNISLIQQAKLFEKNRQFSFPTPTDNLFRDLPSWKTLKFCRILYVTEHFLNDFGWFI